MAELNGNVAIVTGGGSGAGRAIAHVLANAGCRVVIVGRTTTRLDDTVNGYTGGGSIIARATDVAQPDQVADLVAWVHAECGPVDILVNNAGINVRDRRLESLTVGDWDKLIAVNLSGAFYMIHAVLPTMRERKGGLIINISSIAGKRSSVLGGAAYSAGKFGMNALSGVLTQEEAQHGIRSSVICPGEINTPILDDRPVPVSAEHKARILQPEDVAAAVLFISQLPARVHIPELVIKPTSQAYET